MKCDFTRYSPAETSTINTPNSQTCINIPKEGSVISFLDSYLDLNLEVIKKADKFGYANVKNIGLVNLGSIALFSTFKMTTSSGKHLEDISHAHIVPLMFILITSSKDSHALSVGYVRNRNRRRDELAQNKNIKGKYNLRIMLRDVFVMQNVKEKLLLVSVIN